MSPPVSYIAGETAERENRDSPSSLSHPVKPDLIESAIPALAAIFSPYGPPECSKTQVFAVVKAKSASVLFQAKAPAPYLARKALCSSRNWVASVEREDALETCELEDVESTVVVSWAAFT